MPRADGLLSAQQPSNQPAKKSLLPKPEGSYLYIWVLSARASRAARLLCLSDGMSSRGVAFRPLLCGTGNSADARVSSRRAPRPHDTSMRHRVAGLQACCRTQPRALCASTSNAPRGPVEPDAFFNRADELARLQRLLGSAPTAVLLLTGPPSCGKSGACSAEWTVTPATPDSWSPALLKHLVSKTDKPPKPSIIDCRAGGARCTLACCRAAGRWPLSLLGFVSTDYLSPASFSVNLLKCMLNDWQKHALELLRLLVPSSARLAGSTAGIEVSLDYLKRELLQEPTPLNTIIEAYSKMANEAKQKRAPGDPWPVIIVDEANALQEWEDAKSLKALLKLFVYLTKQEQLAHVVLATSDTFLVEWLESGVLLSVDCLFSRGAAALTRRHHGTRRSGERGVS